jgi:hypothetical protein
MHLKPLNWLIRFAVMAIALLFTGNAIGRLGFSALGQVPGTTAWNYAILFYASISIAAIITPKVKQVGLIALGLTSVHTMTTYAAAFAHMTIGLMALSVGKPWGGILLMIGGVYLIGAYNRLLRLLRQFWAWGNDVGNYSG